MPDLPVDDVYGETEGQLAELNPLFAKCFNWEIFRYYYQRAIKAGDDLAGIEKNQDMHLMIIIINSIHIKTL